MRAVAGFWVSNAASLGIARQLSLSSALRQPRSPSPTKTITLVFRISPSLADQIMDGAVAAVGRPAERVVGRRSSPLSATSGLVLALLSLVGPFPAAEALPAPLVARPPVSSTQFSELRRAAASRPRATTALEAARGEELLSRCKTLFRDATLDHYSWAPPPGNITTFRQRYFFCSEHWSAKRGWPIFFYAGNEADVTLYLNNTGLMWENAEDFGALLVFAEHRYYGQSSPFGDEAVDHLQYLTVEQAMADYAELIVELKQKHKCEDSAVIAFGGSYGGMIASWMRMKYPHIITGAIASSAPILSSMGLSPPYDMGSYAKVVSYDCTSKAGAVEGCDSAVRNAWQALFRLGDSAAGRQQIHSAMRLCDRVSLKDGGDVVGLAYWLQSSMDFMAMGNFPYETSYLTNGGGVLPAFPMRAGCRLMMEEAHDGEDFGLLRGIAKFASVFYNATGELECLDPTVGVNPETDLVGMLWGYQSCCDMSTAMSRDGVLDIFWAQPWDQAAFAAGCRSTYNVTPRPFWEVTDYGGRNMAAASNIVFANGEYDPWRGGGVLTSTDPSVVVLDIPGAAHHLDLMFSHPEDSQDVKSARAIQLSQISKWIDDHSNRLQRDAHNQPDSSSEDTMQQPPEAPEVYYVQETVTLGQLDLADVTAKGAAFLSLIAITMLAAGAGCTCCVCCIMCVINSVKCNTSATADSPMSQPLIGASRYSSSSRPYGASSSMP